MSDDVRPAMPRVALITGAGRRIGRAIALALSRAGYAAPWFLTQAFAAQAPHGTDASIVNVVDQRVLQHGPSPQDIAAAVLYLAQAHSVTGVTIAVDGGQHVSWRTVDSDVVE